MSVKDNSCGIADLQDRMLDILKYFISICEKENLSYWAGAGTCLGAIRHQGFIPWDDDLDVYMPRYDYEKFWEIWKKSSKDSRYKLCRTGRNKNYRHRVMQLVDTTTTFINERCANDDIEHGVYIDIIPMDACAPNPIARLSQIFNTVIYSVYNIQCTPEFHGNRLMETGTKFLLGAVKNPDWRYKIWKKAERKMKKYDTSSAKQYVDLLTYFKMIFKPMPSEWFNTRETQFEDIMIHIPAQAEKYLKRIYGDYMLLPPAEERVVQHHTILIDLNKPYTEYRGVYYCKK